MMVLLLLSVSQTFAQESKDCTLIGRWVNGTCRAVAVVGETAYFGNGGYLEMVDFSDPQEIGKIVLPGPVQDVALSGHYAYVAVYGAGLRVIDVSDPAAPIEVGFFDTVGYVCGIAVSGHYA
ncbi:hypothetical protein JXO59_16120 [candidate division KSB1 bacterium]|nr:hypothetical protein [candidate division KSB1 bacterium]